MILGGLALAFSRIIDNSVISLENIYRHLEEGAPPERAAEEGGAEVSLAVLAATLTAVVVFFPVTFLYGVSKFLFTALALAVVISLFASYFVAMTVIPLFCARYLKRRASPDGERRAPAAEGFVARDSTTALTADSRASSIFMNAPCAGPSGGPGSRWRFCCCRFWPASRSIPCSAWPFSPEPMPANSPINLKVPTGTRIEVTEQYVAKVEDLIRKIIRPADFHMIVSTVGLDPGFSSLYTTNAGEYTATIQTALTPSHQVSSFDYMDRVRRQIAADYPDLRTFFSSGSMVDAVLNMGMPAPIDVQVSSDDLNQAHQVARRSGAADSRTRRASARHIFRKT